MKTVALALSALLCAAPAVAEPKLIGGSESIPRNAVCAGGQLAGSASAVLNNAVAETGVSSFTGAGLNLYAGLMNLAAQPGSVTSLVAVSKSTGTMALAWTAPGLDGFVGSVPSGFYRIDTSSDPAHVFDPTVYVTEFATSVVPGAAQYDTLTALAADTTYYTRIYLADARKMAAETSAPGREATFANLPAAPVLSGVSFSSVTFAWALPNGGAQGFDLDASSTDFGTLFPGGTITSSQTPNGLSVTLTVTGLAPGTTYFFRLGSLNWQGQSNFTTVIATCTLPGGALPIQNLSLAGGPLAHQIELAWSNPSFLNPAGVMVLVSTTAITAAPVGGTPYAVGFTFPDGSLVAANAASTTYVASGLPLDTTEYFSLYSKDASYSYSVAVSTFFVLDLPPMAPAGLSTQVNGSSITLSWAPVTSSLDGTSFRSPLAPTAWELDHFNIYRATGIVNSNWVLVGTAPFSATGFTAAIPSPDFDYFYKVVSLDAFDAGATDAAMAADTLGSLYVVDSDQVSRFQIPPALAATVLAGGNATGNPLLVRAQDRVQDLGGRIVKSVQWSPVQSPSDAAAAPFQLAVPSGLAVLHYDIVSGQIVASGAKALAQGPSLKPAVVAGDAASGLGAYWFNGQDYTRLYGKVDPSAQTVQVQSSLLGNYQIRSVLRDAGFAFDLSGISNKALTPNGDGLNDTVVFTFDNPKDSAFSGKIFDLRGALIADLTLGPVANSLMWDGKSNGRVVPRGVYIYQIQAEGRTFSGTVVVIR